MASAQSGTGALVVTRSGVSALGARSLRLAVAPPGGAGPAWDDALDALQAARDGVADWASESFLGVSRRSDEERNAAATFIAQIDAVVSTTFVDLRAMCTPLRTCRRR